VIVLFKYDVLCVGSATVDTFLEVDTSFQKIRLGDKILVKSIIKHSGGGAINSALVLSKLGIKVKVLTKLGNDHDAQFIHQKLSQHHIHNICKNNSTLPTDSSSIIDYQADKDRIIYNHKGASQDLHESDFRKSNLNVKWIYLATLMGKSFSTAIKIAQSTKQNKTKMNLLFNPSLYLAKKGKKYLLPILENTDLLVLNLQETQALLNHQTNNFKILLSELHQLGPHSVVITNGAKKMYALHQDNLFAIMPPKVKIVHTAGAGDAFTAGLLGALLNKHDFQTALIIGQAQATSVIQDKGVAHRLLTETQALQLGKKYRMKVEEVKSMK